MTPDVDTQAKNVAKNSWVKPLYFYSAIGISLIFFLSGLYMLTSSLIVHNFLPDLASANSYSTSPEIQCQDRVNSTTPEGKSNDVSYDQCVKDTQSQQDKSQRISYQQSVLDSTLILVFSGLSLGTHLFLFRSKAS